MKRATTFPFTSSLGGKFGAAILSVRVKPYVVLAAKYDFDSLADATKWANKNLKKLKKT